jgi:hypothetical protein
VGEREGDVNRIGQHEAWDRLQRIPRGAVARVFGVTVRRVDDWEWEIGGEPGRLLLPALDRVMAVAGFVPLQEVRA